MSSTVIYILIGGAILTIGAAQMWLGPLNIQGWVFVCGTILVMGSIISYTLERIEKLLIRILAAVQRDD